MTENQRHGPSAGASDSDSLRPGIGGWLARWEVLLFLMFVAVLVVNSVLSPYFLDLDNMLFATSNFAEKALIALPMALVIIVRDIDVSVASMTAVAAVAIGLSAESGAGPMSLVAIGIGIGTLAGLINGLIVTRLRIHSIVVTIGTLSLYRGLAVVFIGERALTKFPAGFDYLGQGFVFSVVPFGFVLFLVCALSFGLCFGSRRSAARFTQSAAARTRRWFRVSMWTAIGWPFLPDRRVQRTGSGGAYVAAAQCPPQRRHRMGA